MIAREKRLASLFAVTLIVTFAVTIIFMNRVPPLHAVLKITTWLTLFATFSFDIRLFLHVDVVVYVAYNIWFWYHFGSPITYGICGGADLLYSLTKLWRDRSRTTSFRHVEPARGVNLAEVTVIQHGWSCVICLEENFLNVVKTKCGHDFHLKCITEWASKKFSCPLCRGDLRNF